MIKSILLMCGAFGLISIIQSKNDKSDGVTLHAQAIELKNSNGDIVRLRIAKDGSFRVGNRHGEASLTLTDSSVKLQLSNSKKASLFTVEVDGHGRSRLFLYSGSDIGYGVDCSKKGTRSVHVGPSGEKLAIMSGERRGDVNIVGLDVKKVPLFYLGTGKKLEHGARLSLFHSRQAIPFFHAQANLEGDAALGLLNKSGAKLMVLARKSGTSLVLSKVGGKDGVLLKAMEPGTPKVSVFDDNDREINLRGK